MSNAPTLDANKQFLTVSDLLWKSQDSIAATLPKHLTPERMLRVALTTIRANPRLLLCSPLSIVGTVVQASQLGLELNGFLGEAYMVPYWNHKLNNKKGGYECQFQAGYRGLIALARRSGQVDTVRPVLVYEGDHFEIEEGTEPRIIHRPDYDSPTRGKQDQNGDLIGLRGCYAVVKYLTGAIDFEYCPLTRLDELRGMTKAVDKDGYETGPWVQHPAEMYRKVPIRQLAKRLPLSPEFQKAGVLDEYGDVGVRQNLGAIIEADPNGFREVLTNVAQQRSDDLAAQYARPQHRQGAAASPQQQAAQEPPPREEPPMEAYEQAAPEQPYRPSNAERSYTEQFPAAAPRPRRRATRGR